MSKFHLLHQYQYTNSSPPLSFSKKSDAPSLLRKMKENDQNGFVRAIKDLA